uniref:Chromo domain-containing protein n=2 Tax=Strongyloides stercoralis TaxID=6248 RepID=A0AAF5CZ24_STRER
IHCTMGDIYIVEKLLNSRVRKNKKEYLVKWKEWGSKHNTWEPEDNILDERLIQEYEDNKKNKKKQKENSSTVKRHSSGVPACTPIPPRKITRRSCINLKYDGNEEIIGNRKSSRKSAVEASAKITNVVKEEKKKIKEIESSDNESDFTDKSESTTTSASNTTDDASIDDENNESSVSCADDEDTLDETLIEESCNKSIQSELEDMPILQKETSIINETTDPRDDEERSDTRKESSFGSNELTIDEDSSSSDEPIIIPPICTNRHSKVIRSRNLSHSSSGTNNDIVKKIVKETNKRNGSEYEFEIKHDKEKKANKNLTNYNDSSSSPTTSESNIDDGSTTSIITQKFSKDEEPHIFRYNPGEITQFRNEDGELTEAIVLNP